MRFGGSGWVAEWCAGAAGCLVMFAAQGPAYAQMSTHDQTGTHQMVPGADHHVGSRDHEHAALMTGPLGIPRARMGSGTAWVPDSSPMFGLMAPLGDGGLMFHENVFVGFDWFGSDRGSSRALSVNWLMVSAWQPLGPGEVTARVMLSAEPLTVGKRGYPLILQTGETANGEPLHDRQHPHDFFMELALDYVLPLSRGLALEIYAAAAGEPALGPVAYPHRVSALSDPLAPISHHWQDSTHISFGVVTVGLFTRGLKLEGSWFNGREPDEGRWDLDLRVPDSYAGRITWNPAPDWSMQGSYAYLHRPEPLEPDVSVKRVTGSVSHNARTGHRNWATTLVIGVNVPSEGPATPATLLETNVSLTAHHGLFGRIEYVRKSGHDLALPEAAADTAFNVGLLGLGYVYYLGPFAGFSPGIGLRGSVGFADSRLNDFYGTQFPLGGIVFAQIRPAVMAM